MKQLCFGAVLLRSSPSLPLYFFNLGYDLSTPPEYSRYSLKNGSMQEKREVVKAFGGPLCIHNQSVCQMSVRVSKPVVSEELVSMELNSVQQ